MGLLGVLDSTYTGTGIAAATAVVIAFSLYIRTMLQLACYEYILSL